MSSRKVRTRKGFAALLSAVTLIASLGVVAVQAVHNDGLFELDTATAAAICAPLPAPCGDANVADNPAGGADDWANVYKSFSGNGTAGPDHAFGRAFITDKVSSAEDSFFTGGGSKDEREISQWLYGTSNDVVPDKDDISHAFAAAYTGGGDTVIYFGIDRYDNNGDAETGFWFFEKPVSLGANGKFTGVHTVGDVLVLANWGGSNPVGAVTVYEWVGGRNPLQLVSDTTAADCANILGNDNVCAVVNRQTVAQPWPFLDKGASTSIRPLELFEAGLNVTQLFGEDKCFASFLANTRSSHSTTAQLKDFALGSFEQCGASIQISPNAVNKVGDTHTFTVHVDKTVGGTQAPVQGVKPTVTLTATGGAVVTGKVDNCATTGTNASGNCTVTFTSNSVGVVTGHAAAAVVIGGDTFNVETNGTAPNSGDAVKRFVDASVAIAPTAVNEVNNSHTFTITATPHLATGTTVQSVAITPSLSPAVGAGQSSSNTCATPTLAAGVYTCTLTVNSATPATFTANASATIVMQDGATPANTASVTRSTSGTAGPSGSGPATKRFVDASVAISPSAVNEVKDSHVFTITASPLTTSGATVKSITITPSLSPAPGAGQSTSNTCATPTLAAGVYTCTLSVSSDSVATFTANASITVVFTDGATPEHTASVTRSTSGNAGPSGSGPAAKRFADASIAISPTAVNEVKNSHSFTITASPHLPSGASVDSITITPSLSPAVGAGQSTSNTCATPTLAAGVYTCTLTVNSDTPAVFTANASLSVVVKDGATPANTETITRSTSGTAGPSGSGPATKRFVDASVTINPSATNSIGETHTFTVTVTPHLATGTTVKTIAISTSLSPAPGAGQSSSNTCATPVLASGSYTCTLTVSSASVATFTANASATIVFTDSATPEHTASVVRATNGNAGPNGSGPATKVFVAGTLVWHKVDQNGDPLGGATFEYCRTHTWSTALAAMVNTADVCVPDVLDNAAPDADPADGEFKIVNLVLGRYTVRETAPPAGYTMLNDDPVTAPDITPANLNSEIVTPFVNVALYRLIIVTCNDTTDELIVSTVDLDGSVKDTIAGVPAALATKGVTQADLCGLGGASYGGLEADDYVPTVTIPKGILP
jgi:hypothetical protein